LNREVEFSGERKISGYPKMPDGTILRYSAFLVQYSVFKRKIVNIEQGILNREVKFSGERKIQGYPKMPDRTILRYSAFLVRYSLFPHSGLFHWNFCKKDNPVLPGNA
jgi:hypothetical protein